jgi:hypothetical protein
MNPKTGKKDLLLRKPEPRALLITSLARAVRRNLRNVEKLRKRSSSASLGMSWGRLWRLVMCVFIVTMVCLLVAQRAGLDVLHEGSLNTQRMAHELYACADQLAGWKCAAPRV